MCGIIASCMLGKSSASADPFATNRHKLGQDLVAALESIKYRGPDGSSVWVSDDGRIGLGHCRLAINDLSDAGLQPLHNGVVHAVVNGEIYEYDRLRDECVRAGYEFSSTSDSELVMALYKMHGVPDMFQHLRGEFAFVLYDQAKDKVVAGRDRYGIKPLMWTTIGDTVLIAAEAKAFLAMGWQAEWDVNAITDCGWMCDERTIFRGVKKLLPGKWMEITALNGIQIHQYWDMEYPDKTVKDIRNIDDMVVEVRKRFVDAVRVRMKADVPVGVYLSGGIDSSAVAGVMTHLARNEQVNVGNQDTTRVSCFTIQFPDNFSHDESAIAARTAKSLGIKLYKKYVDEQVLADGFEDTAYHSEHHTFDMNSIAKYALSTLPAEHGVKVVLTGEGADEHFAGYSFILAQFLQEADLSMPDSAWLVDDELREALYKSADAETARIWEAQGCDLHEGPQNVNESSPLRANPWTIVAFQPAAKLYSSWVHDQYGGEWDRRQTVEAGCGPEIVAKMRDKWHTGHTMLYLTARCIMQNILLAGLGDRTEMAHSIEGRPAILDHHLTEYVNMLPPSVKAKYTPPAQEEDKFDAIQGFWWQSAGSGIRSQTEKWILREAVKPFVTDELYRRRKQPFMCPWRWPANGPLHTMFRRLLTKEAVEELGFVDYSTVEEALNGAFGADAKPDAIRVLGFVGAWVAIGRRFGIKKATAQESGWA